MKKKILVDASYPENIQVAVIENGRLEDLEYSSSKKMITGNVYLAKVTRVEPSLQAAFIDYGGEKHGFISFAEIHSGYYDIPLKYRNKNQDQDASTAVSSMEALKAIKVDNTKHGKKPTSVKYSSAEDGNDNQGEIAAEGAIEENTDDAASLDEGYLEKIKQENVEKYKIQEVIKRNQILLVQAVREERGNKGASFTTYISLAGRYCVIMSNSGSKGGVSRKIADVSERKRLKNIVDNIESSDSIGVIIRTVGQGHSEAEIKQDYNYLVRIWNEIREKTLASAAPAFIYSEEDILKKVVRDLYDNDTSEILVQGDECYREISQIAKMISQGEDIIVKQYKENVPIFSKHKINEQITNLYNPVAHTESGAYIVINHTEALIAIDVNSGKSTSEKNIEEMAVRTNIEAAKEIARQIKLRDLSGIIVIDFIDMVESKNKRLVERTLREKLYQDKAKVQMGHISSLGLIEMSRQRLKPSLLESNTVVCNNCCGKGVVRSNDTNSVMILKTIEEEISNNHFNEINVYTAPEISLYILNCKRKEFAAIEERHGVKIYFYQDSKMSADGFALETVSKSDSVEIEDESNDHDNTSQFQHNNERENVEQLRKEKVNNNYKRTGRNRKPQYLNKNKKPLTE